MTKQFVVMGMHRSFTSGVAEGLHRAGVEMGDDMLGRSKSQPTGHWEDREFLRLNEEILKATGHSWRNPPTQQAVHAIDGTFAGRIRAMVAHRDKRYERWGFKDPRSAILWPLYEPYFVDDLHLVCVFRGPAQVARSLSSRNGMALSKGEQLAALHNKLILAAARDLVGL